MTKTKLSFYLHNDKEQPVTAGGIIFYRIVNNSVDLLLMESRGNIEDFGGSVDTCDKTLDETIAREVDEESNNLFKKNDIITRLHIDNRCVYNKRCKYALYIVQATDVESKYKTLDFGDIELHDNIERIVKWIPLHIFMSPEFIKHRLNWRLKNKQLFDELYAIKKIHTKEVVKKMFSSVKKLHSDSSDDSDSSTSSDDSH